MRPPLLILAAMLVAFCLADSAAAQCPGGVCPTIQADSQQPVFEARPLARAVTVPVRAVVRAQPIRRVIKWRPLARLRARLRR